VAAALRVLVYGEAFDQSDHFLRMSEESIRQSFLRLTRHITGKYFKEIVRLPTNDEARAVSYRFEQRGFPGCVGSIDCCKVYWKNCPTAWAGQYQGREGSPTIVLEAIVDDRRRFQHAYFGKPGSCNDINVLESSTLKTAIIAGRWPPKVEFNICGVKHNLAYVLADGIYPNWRCFVQTVPRSSRPTPAQMAFSAAQEAVRKDVECAFGIMQARFAFTRTPVRLWDVRDVKIAVLASIVLHNMIIDERFAHIDSTRDEHASSEPEIHTDVDMATLQVRSLRNLDILTDVASHRRLKSRLVQHISNRSGEF
jgi:hypothetical protein